MQDCDISVQLATLLVNEALCGLPVTTVPCSNRDDARILHGPSLRWSCAVQCLGSAVFSVLIQPVQCLGSAVFSVLIQPVRCLGSAVFSVLVQQCSVSWFCRVQCLGSAVFSIFVLPCSVSWFCRVQHLGPAVFSILVYPCSVSFFYRVQNAVAHRSCLLSYRQQLFFILNYRFLYITIVITYFQLRDNFVK